VVGRRGVTSRLLLTIQPALRSRRLTDALDKAMPTQAHYRAKVRRP